MEVEGKTGSEIREVRLEGVILYVVGGLFLAALAGAFYLGKWVEHRSSPQGFLPAESPGDAPGAVGQESREIGQEASDFDTITDREQEAEPERQVGRPPQAHSDAGESRGGVGATSPTQDGRFFVQVFALRDQGSAQNLLNGLSKKGFPVRLDTEREGEGALYKIRVGGYATRHDASAMADRLRTDGYPGAFVVTIP